MHISKVDLNLFVVFDAIYAEGGLTRASQRLNLTQPAVSHALARLRHLLNDPLFERQGHTMVPTPLARNIIEQVRNSLRGFELTVTGTERFDPATSERTFTLAMRDVVEPNILPPLMAAIAAAAPSVGLNALRMGRNELEAELAAGTVDAAIDVLLPLSDHIRTLRLPADSTVVLARRGHPHVQEAMDLDLYLSQQHIQVSSRRAGPSLEDVELGQRGLQRRIRMRCQHYFTACSVVSQTDLLLTMPERYGRVLNQQFGHQILPLPLQLPAISNHLYWHTNVDHDLANRWLREQIARVISELPA
ncbi:LysR family transcriptional regulator [Pseudoduganella namucuonensis]|uniref:DNA-binding transcriptional regulator, LysR family n=1 Tax=Pseudoduganella namucuonensis TaxID=1035707 RepID=A0A1I7F5B6_9BURK|nr:LysR family transcriptional regulator [Pseudoduganella namucuonensis]SFU31346.1 DNA-binding transcriptional regulator, LysR family [Pseudoduganella namucuonensis]